MTRTILLIWKEITIKMLFIQLIIHFYDNTDTIVCLSELIYVSFHVVMNFRNLSC